MGADEEKRLAAINAGFIDAFPSHMPAREIAAKLGQSGASPR
ncbi:MAG: hypothetical protein ACRDJF_01950 [Actinomycetota bacterium]